MRGDIELIMDVPLPEAGFVFVTDDREGTVSGGRSGSTARSQGEVDGDVAGHPARGEDGTLSGGKIGGVR